MEYLPDPLDAVTKLVKFSNIGLAHVNSNLSRERDKKMFDETIKHMRELQQNEILEVRKTYIMSSFHDMERHFQQLNSDLIQGSKEFEKDMVDQQTLWCQTIILAGTIMILGLITVLIQGVLPSEHTDDKGQFNDNVVATSLYTSYAVSNAGSMTFLFISIVVYIEIVHRVSEFNHQRSTQHTKILKSAMAETKQLLENLHPDDIEPSYMYQSDNFEYIPLPKSCKNHNHKNRGLSMDISVSPPMDNIPLVPIPENDDYSIPESKDAESASSAYNPIYNRDNPISWSNDPINTHPRRPSNTSSTATTSNYNLLPMNQHTESHSIDIRMSEHGRFIGGRNISSSSLATISEDDNENSDYLFDESCAFDSNIPLTSTAVRNATATATATTTGTTPSCGKNNKWSYSNIFGPSNKHSEYQHKKNDNMSLHQPHPVSSTSLASSHIHESNAIKNNQSEQSPSFLSSMYTYTEQSASNLISRRSTKRIRKSDSDNVLSPTSSVNNSFTIEPDITSIDTDGSRRKNKPSKRFSLLQNSSRRKPKWKPFSTTLTRSDSASFLPTRQTIATMDPLTVDIEFRSHEDRVLGVFMNQRDEINARTAKIYDVETSSFEHYWNEYCRELNTLGVFCFYIGAALM